MLDTYTLQLSRSQLGRFLFNAGQHPTLRIRKDQHNHLMFHAEALPSLDDFRTDDFPPVQIQSQQRVGYSDFWSLARELVGKAISATCDVDISECGLAFNPEEQEDVRLGFGFGFCGPLITLSTGGVTPAAKDLSYRCDLFNRFLRALGLSGRLETLIVDGELDMLVHDPRFRNARRSVRSEPPKARQGGALFFDSCCTNTNGRDFRGLTLYCFALDELEQKVPDVVQALGGESRIVASTFSVASTKENYPRVREILNDSPFGPWRISLTAIGRYSLENLDDAVAENESFLFRAFTLDPPGIGEVDVDISYDKGSFSLHFYCVYESNEQERALHDLIIQFAGGEDIIDHALL